MIEKNQILTSKLLNKKYINNFYKILILSSSYEKRCLGLMDKLSLSYDIDKIFIFKYDTVNLLRDKNLVYMKKKFNGVNGVKVIETNLSEPIKAMNVIYSKIIKMRENKKFKKEILIDADISTLNKKHMLMLLQYIKDLNLWDNLRIIYTEPKNYVTNLYLPMSTGLKSINILDGFISKYSPSLKKLLIIFLGYEGDRAFTIYEQEDPDEVILIIPKPPYRKEWEGKTEYMNSVIINTVGKNKIRYAHSREPNDVVKTLTELSYEYPFQQWRWSIVPLGTKPQTLGIYYYWKKEPYKFSMIYAQPLKHNVRFYSTGVGDTWLLKDISARVRD